MAKDELRPKITYIVDYIDELEKNEYAVQRSPGRQIRANNAPPYSILDHDMNRLVSEGLNMLMNRCTRKDITDIINRKYNKEYNVTEMEVNLSHAIDYITAMTQNFVCKLKYDGPFEIHKFSMAPSKQITLIQNSQSRFIIAYEITTRSIELSELERLLFKFHIITGMKLHIGDTNSGSISTKKDILNFIKSKPQYKQYTLDGIHQRDFNYNDVESAWDHYREISGHDQSSILNNERIMNCFIIYFNYLRSNQLLTKRKARHSTLINKTTPITSLEDSLRSMTYFDDLMRIEYDKNFLFDINGYGVRIAENSKEYKLTRTPKLTDEDTRSLSCTLLKFGFQPSAKEWKKCFASYVDRARSNKRDIEINRSSEICVICGKICHSPQQIADNMGFRRARSKIKNEQNTILFITQPHCKKCKGQYMRRSHKKNKSLGLHWYLS